MDLDQFYDEINVRAFKGQLPKIPVQWSRRMVRAAGIFYEPEAGRRRGIIKLSKPLLMERPLNFPVTVAGLVCADREEIVKRVLEHEMLHVLLWAEERENGHTEEFCRLAYEYFGHTEVKHTLRYGNTAVPTEQFGIGSYVRFPFREQFLRGVILSIRRNATVLADDDRKFYVPLSLLRSPAE